MVNEEVKKVIDKALVNQKKNPGSLYQTILSNEDNINFLAVFCDITYTSYFINQMSKEDILSLLKKNKIKPFLEGFFMYEPKFLIEKLSMIELIEVYKNANEYLKNELFLHIIRKREDYTSFLDEKVAPSLQLEKYTEKYMLDIILRNGEMKKKGRNIPILYGVNHSLKTPKDFSDLFSNYNKYLKETIEEIRKDNEAKKGLIESYEIILKNYRDGENIFEFLNATRFLPQHQELVEKNKDLILSKIMHFKKEEDPRLFHSLSLAIEDIMKSEKLTWADMSFLQKGSYSKAYKIGSYVIKWSKSRNTHKIPYHRRFLYPLLRKKINEKGNYVEITPFVIGGTLLHLTDDDVYRIYKELRDDGIIWLDPRIPNMGMLLHDNIPYLHQKELKVHPDSISFENMKIEEPLKKGEYVVLDVDTVVYEKDFHENIIDTNSPAYESFMKMEERYQLDKKREFLEQKFGLNK